MCGSEDGSSPGVFLPVLIFFQLFVQPDGVGFHGDIVADPHQGQRQFQNTEQQETSPQRNAFKPSEESRARSVQDIRGHRPDGRAEGGVFIRGENHGFQHGKHQAGGPNGQNIQGVDDPDTQNPIPHDFAK